MSRIGYEAVQRGYMTKQNLAEVIQEQWKQEWANSGKSQLLGELSVNKGFMAKRDLDSLIETMLMEPNISWEEGATFSDSLHICKPEKQMIGEYVGKLMTREPDDITIFLANSSTIYYAFLGIAKHRAKLHVLTIHAAVLAAYPSMKSQVKSVRTVWKGRVDVDNALIESDNLDDPRTKAELAFFDGEITHSFLSPTGFDQTYGPMGTNRVAREVARRALQSGTRTFLLMDHTKIRTETKKGSSELLFPQHDEWNNIRDHGNIGIIMNCHPAMPKALADREPSQRTEPDIKQAMSTADNATIREVLRYHQWSMRVRDMLTEVKYNPA